MTRKDIIKYGIEVFNNKEEKFYSWYNKESKYLKQLPKDLNSKELKEELDKIEYGNFS